MSLLDRLRGQPGWRHEDPSVRASAVDDLEDDAQELFEAIASEDADPEVRLAALVRLSDPAAIGRIARADADPQVRDEATAMLRAAAVAASEPADGEAALAGLSEARDVGEVARVARVESVSRSALARLDSQRAIGAVARRSAHRAVREAALAKLDDRDELAAVAVKTDHREVALAAFDRLVPLGSADRDLLQAIAVRARTKPVSRRAKSALAALDARPQPPTPEEVRARREELCERVEMLAGVQRRDAVSTELDQAERDWRALAAPGDAPPASAAPGAGESISDAPPVSAAVPPATDAPPASEAPPAAASPAADAPPPAAALVAGGTPVAGDAPDAADAPVPVTAPASTVAPVPDDAPSAGGQAGAPTDADPALAERWRAAVAGALDHLAQLDKAQGVADQRRQARRDALAARAALCDRLAALADDEARDADALAAEIDVVRAEWTALPEVPPGDDDAAADRGAGDAAADRVAGDTAADRGAGDVVAGGRVTGDAAAQVDRRFNELTAAAGRQVDRHRAAAARLPRLTALVEQLEAVSAATDPEALTKGWKQPHREWTALAQESTAAELAGLTPRVEAAERKRSERLTAARETRRRREQANLARQQARCDDIERALADEQLELKDAERCLRLTRSLLGDPGRLPSRQDREALAKRLRAAQTALTGRVRELRGLAEWKQWANVGVQAALCQRLEALAERGDDDDEAFAREFREIMSEWRQASDVARDEGNDVWQRFKAAHDAVHPRFEAWQDAQAGVRRENLAKKVALCEEAERLAESTEWIKVAQRMTELQEQWKQVGSAARKDEREVWNRFRAASGHFFRRRRQDLAERKQVWAKNAQLKEELCGKAEALADESDLEAAKAAVRQLQAEWKTVGPVRRSRSETLWRRFRAACDDIHARAQAAIDAPYAELIQARAAVCDRLEALAPSPDAAGGAADAPSPKAVGGAADAPSPKAVGGAADAPSPDAAGGAADAPAPDADGAADAPAPDADGAADAPAPDAAAGAADAPAPDAAGTADAPAPDAAAGAADAPAPDAAGADTPSPDAAGDAADAPAPDAAAGAADAPAPAAGAAGPPPDLAATVEAARREWRAMEPIPRPQERSLTARFDAAVNLLVDRFPGAFAGTDLDPVRHLPALERLCERVEAMIREDDGAPSAEARSPSEILAARLREALASNTMGAGADADARRREDAETMGRLQAERRALGVIPGEAGRQLSERFRAACDRFFKLNPTPPPAPSSGAGKPRRGGSSRASGPSRRRRG